ncbi:hypothetical protein D3C71_1622420 [compost metagenome]
MQLLELCLEHAGGLDPEAQACRIAWHQQRLARRQLLHAVVPIGQADDVVILHGAQQLAALGALLEAVDRVQVVEQEGQIEDLQLLGVFLEFGQ